MLQQKRRAMQQVQGERILPSAKEKKSLMQQQYVQKKRSITPTKFLATQDFQGATNSTVTSFNFKIQQPTSQTTTIAWQYTVPILRQNQKALFLVTQQFQTVILDYAGQDFPQSISFTFQGFNGYLNKQGTPTNKFIVMDLISTSIKTTQYGMVTRDLVYKSQLPNVWPMGSLRSLKMQIYLQDETTPLNLPLTNPIQVAFKIVHVSL